MPGSLTHFTVAQWPRFISMERLFAAEDGPTCNCKLLMFWNYSESRQDPASRTGVMGE